MKKIAVFVLLTFVLTMMAMASEKSTMKGWISDAMCGAKGAKAAHADCAKKCAEAGEALVFVSDKDQSVTKIANQDSVKGHAGEHVEITGTMDNGSLKVDNVKTIAENSSKAAGMEHKH